jgi:hypothetical protein
MTCSVVCMSDLDAVLKHLDAAMLDMRAARDNGEVSRDVLGAFRSLHAALEALTEHVRALP